jgi:NTE family protein
MSAEELGLTGRIGLALGSGAARGWAHVGVIRALAERGIEPDVVGGTSMGAIVGAAYSAGQIDDFETWACELEWRQVMSYLDLSFRGGLINARRLFQFFEDVLPGRTIGSLERPFAAVGTDLANGQEVWMRQGDLLAALRASIALPGLITPSQWEGRWMVDGGLVNPVPVSLCRALGADSVIAVDLNTTLLGRRFVPEVEPVPAESPPEVARPSDSRADDAAIDEDAPLGARLNGMLREFAADIRSRVGSDAPDDGPSMPSLYDVMANAVNIMQVRIGRSRMAGDPPELLIAPRMSGFGILDFDRAEEAIEEGRRAVARALAVNAASQAP